MNIEFDMRRAALCVAACAGIPNCELDGARLAERIDGLRRALDAKSPDVHPLQFVFDECVAQAASGKGEERHGHGADFFDQPWLQLTEAFGVGGPLFQASKKIRESVQWLNTDEPHRFKKELLGAINYVAMAILAVEGDEDEGEDSDDCQGCAHASCSGCQAGEVPAMTQMKFDPVTGDEFMVGPHYPDDYRLHHGPVAWLYNPWTGQKRDPRDIGSDVLGHLISPQ